MVLPVKPGGVPEGTVGGLTGATARARRDREGFFAGARVREDRPRGMFESEETCALKGGSDPAAQG